MWIRKRRESISGSGDREHVHYSNSSAGARDSWFGGGREVSDDPLRIQIPTIQYNPLSLPLPQFSIFIFIIYPNKK